MTDGTCLYQNPVVYDVLHGPDTAGEAEGLREIARRHVADPLAGRWLEPACGTARHLRVLARAGIAVAGFDRSVSMIHYARRKMDRIDASAELFVADMEDFAGLLPPNSCAFAFNLGNTIRHLSTDEALLSHLDGMATVLRRGGVYAVGLSLSRYGEETIEEDFWTARRGGTRVDHLVQYVPPGARETGLPPVGDERVELLIHHVAVIRPGGVEHHDFTDRLRTWDAGEWSDVIARSPFRVTAVVDRTGDPLDSGVFDYGIHLLRHRAD